MVPPITKRPNGGRSDEITRLRTLVDNIPGALFQLQLSSDDHPFFIFASNRLADLCGLTPEKAAEDATILFDTIHPEDRLRVEHSLLSSAQTLLPWQLTFRITHPNGRTIWIEGKALPQRHADGSVLFNGYFHEVTQHKEMERQLQQLNDFLDRHINEELARRMQLQREEERSHQLLIQQSKMAEMGSMIVAIAHQWKQPLNIIGLWAQNLKGDFYFGTLTKESIEETVDRILEQVNFLSQTIEDFRNFFKPSREMVPFSARKCADDVCRLMTADLDRHHITVVFTDGDDGHVLGYPNEFKHVLLNIINNAKDAFLERHVPEPHIDIDLQVTSKTITITISDNAGGIAQELLPERLFEPFVSTKGDQGTGIGLYIARQIVEKMEGSLTARNHDNGAQFLITLPRYQN
ncbi:MAG: PAS domain-containing sensor histidine kinase [Campylobacterales bacterium]